MEDNVFINSSISRILKWQKKPVTGDLYGIVINNKVYVLCCYKEQHELNHDPTLLIPSPLCKVGTFDVSEVTHVPKLQRDTVFLGWNFSTFHVFCGSPVEVNPIWISEQDINSMFIRVEVNFNFDLSSKDKTADVKNVVNGLVDVVESRTCLFHLKDSKLLLQGKDSVLCLDDMFKNSNDVLQSMFVPKAKKFSICNCDTAVFSVLLNCSAAQNCNAPVVRVDIQPLKVISSWLNGRTVVYIPRTAGLEELGKLISRGIVRHLHLAEYWLVRQLTDGMFAGNLKSFIVYPHVLLCILSLVYPCNADEEALEGYRAQLHNTFMLPEDTPFVRKSNNVLFYSHSGYMTNVHIGVKPSTITGTEYLVKGTYSYHHYMQDHFNDNKWGCAYRSLQTLVSWFRYQGYVSKDIPCHREIQQCLCDIGDKPHSFIGSHQWIGSTEVGYVLDSLYGISSKFIYVGSGTELVDKGRELALHFEYQGTPVMIGGGVLAHTILGVKWNSDTGDINFLVLDPHYTGEEDIAVIHKQNWCGWKEPSFWDASSYYNLCLPQRPKIL